MRSGRSTIHLCVMRSRPVCRGNSTSDSTRRLCAAFPGQLRFNVPVAWPAFSHFGFLNFVLHHYYHLSQQGYLFLSPRPQCHRFCCFRDVVLCRKVSSGRCGFFKGYLDVWAKRLGKESLVGYQASTRGGVMQVAVRGDCIRLSGQAVTVLRGELI